MSQWWGAFCAKIGFSGGRAWPGSSPSFPIRQGVPVGFLRLGFPVGLLGSVLCKGAPGSKKKTWVDFLAKATSAGLTN